MRLHEWHTISARTSSYSFWKLTVSILRTSRLLCQSRASVLADIRSCALPVRSWARRCSTGHSRSSPSQHRRPKSMAVRHRPENSSGLPPCRRSFRREPVLSRLVQPLQLLTDRSRRPWFSWLSPIASTGLFPQSSVLRLPRYNDLRGTSRHNPACCNRDVAYWRASDQHKRKTAPAARHRAGIPAKRFQSALVNRPECAW